MTRLIGLVIFLVILVVASYTANSTPRILKMTIVNGPCKEGQILMFKEPRATNPSGAYLLECVWPVVWTGVTFHTKDGETREIGLAADGTVVWRFVQKEK